MLRPPAIARHERAGPSGIYFVFHGVNIAPSFTGERNLPNISKTTLDFLVCQGKEGRGQRAKGERNAALEERPARGGT